MPGFTSLKNWLVPMTKEEHQKKSRDELRCSNEEVQMNRSAQTLVEEAKKVAQKEVSREWQQKHCLRMALLKEMTDPFSGKVI